MTAKITNLKDTFRDLLAGGSYRKQIECNPDRQLSTEFAVGALYFMLWYPDQKNQNESSGLFLIPDSLVFVGKNVDEIEERDTWYFQDTKSYCAYGAYPNNQSSGIESDEYYGRLYALHEEDLIQIVDCQGLIDALTKCMERRSKSGRPT